MLISGDTKVCKLFDKGAPTDRFTTELLNDGSVRITKVDTETLRTNANHVASKYVTRIEKHIAAWGYNIYFLNLSVSQIVCLILRNNKLIYSGFSKCNMDKDMPDAAIGEALALWRAVTDTPFERKLPEIVWNYVFNF